VDVQGAATGSREAADLSEPDLVDGSERARNSPETGKQDCSGHVGPEQARLTVPMGVSEALQVFEDRVVVGNQVYPFDDWFGARLVTDPRAPLTIRPPLAVALVSHDARWTTYVPPNEQDAVQVIATVREACKRLGFEPIGIDESVQVPQLAGQSHPHLYSWEVEHADYVAFNPVEAVLATIVHLSLFFFPVVLPVLVWRALRHTAPTVAGQAKEAAEFQGLFYVVALPMVGVTARLMRQHVTNTAQPALVLGMMAVGIVLVIGLTFAFAGARQSVLGRGFSYRKFAHATQAPAN
jgi:uncharacterized Tic20 family protein